MRSLLIGLVAVGVAVGMAGCSDSPKETAPTPAEPAVDQQGKVEQPVHKGIRVPPGSRKK